MYSEITKIFFLFQNDVISCAQQVELLEQQLATRMEQLQATVQSKTAVPTAQVYVSFNINGKKNQRVITVSKVVFEKYMKANRKQKKINSWFFVVFFLKESFMTYVRHK